MPRSVHSVTSQMPDYDFHNSVHKRPFGSDSCEKWLQLVRLMAHICLYEGCVRMQASTQQGLKTAMHF